MVYLGTKAKKTRKIFIQLFVVAFLFSLGFFFGIYLIGKKEIVKELGKKEAVYLGKVLGKYSEPEKGKLSQDVNFKLFWNVWDSLEKQYVAKDDLNEKKMFYGAIKGMTEAIGDPYTIFMEPIEAADFAQDLEGSFEGIGAEIGLRDDIITIIAPLDGMPAQSAGIKSGDKVLAINNEITTGLRVDEAVRKIRGPKGTEVVLTILRNGEKKAQDIKIIRNTITVKSIKTEMRDDKIFVIKVTNFNTDTNGLFKEAVAKIDELKPMGIILDLRNNPGGFLDTAVEMASEWIDSGVVVSEKFGDDTKNDFMARGRANLKDYKTVVLVNEGSASASEIVSGALKDYNKAQLVGKKTYGKGSVQTVENLTDGSSLKITIAKWLTPSGKNISKEGIEPDITIEFTDKEYLAGVDPQMDKAVELLGGKLKSESEKPKTKNIK